MTVEHSSGVSAQSGGGRSLRSWLPPARILAYLGFLTLVPLAAHEWFSRLGFNPTDDGFVLAVSRRLLAGEIPHRDFIAIHTVGSAVLHLPFVLFGGAHAYLASRAFVCFEFAAIALAWTRVIWRLMRMDHPLPVEIAIATIAFVLSFHYFPPMAWPTVDGLLFAGVGLLLCTAELKSARLLGYLLLGAAYVCKQNFFPIFPASVLLLGDRRNRAAWIMGSLPGLAYVGLLAVSDALRDAFVQLASQTDIVSVGVQKYLWEYATPWGTLSGYVVMRVLDQRNRSTRGGLDSLAAALLIFVSIGAACWALADGRFLGAPSFGLFGLALGALLYSAFEEEQASRWVTAGALVVIVSWCASISIGYNTPALAAGICAAYLLSLVVAQTEVSRYLHLAGRSWPYLILSAWAAVTFGIARHSYIYLDRPAAELKYPLDDILPGGAGLLTGENTYAFLVDLRRAIGTTGGGRYAILPDLAGYWVEAKELNPLLTDWPNWIELAHPRLLARVLRQLDSERPNVTFIVEKVDAFRLARGFAPMLSSDRYAVASYVRRNYRKTGETLFFELYQ